MAKTPTAQAETPADRMAEERTARDAAAVERAEAAAAAKAAGKPEPAAPKAPEPSDKPQTYRAAARGYADGRLIEEGEVFSTTAPKGTWMDPVKEKEGKLAREIDNASRAIPDDVDLTQASPAALEALALMKGISPKGLSKDDLLAAIRASFDRDRTQ